MGRNVRIGDTLTRPGTARPRDGEPMSDEELVGLIQRKVNLAMNDEDGALSDVRANLFDAYVGKRFGNERMGRSSIITREVLEAVEWAMPDYVEAFLTSPEIVEFQPQDPEDDDSAATETAAVNYYLRQNISGPFMPLYSWMKDALMQPTAYLKVYPETKEKKEFERYQGLDDNELEDLRNDPDIEIEHVESYEDEVELKPGVPMPPGGELVEPIMPPPPLPPGPPRPPGPPMPPGPLPPGLPPGQPPPPPSAGPGAPMGPGGPTGMPSAQGIPPGPLLPELPPERPVLVRVPMHDVDVIRMTERTEIKLEPLPGEEVLIDRDTTEVDLDTAKSVIHRTRKTYTELLELGYDEDLIEEAGRTTGEHEFQDERVNRLFREDENPDLYEDDDAASAYYWLLECYMYVDYDGDGRAEFRRVVLINTTILENERCDFMPIVAMCSIPIPHKHNGTSPAELVYDLQRIQSQLHRQMLDNMYAINSRRKYIDESLLLTDGQTIDAIRQAVSEWVPTQGPPQAGLLFEPTTNIIGDVLQSITAIKELGKLRTGIAPDLNVDPAALKQSTAAAFTQAQSGAHKRQVLTIRVMGETGFRKLGIKLHQILRQYIDHEIRFKIKKQWRSTNPSEWRHRTDIAISPGLGQREQQVQTLMAVLAEQKEAMALGMTTPQQLFSTYSRLTESVGLTPTAKYFVDPESPEYVPPQPPPPSPLEQAQAEAMSAQAEDFRARAQTHMVDAQGKMMAAQSKAQADTQKAEVDAQRVQADMQKAQLDAEIGLKKAQIEDAKLQVEQYRLQLEKARLEAELGKIHADTGSVEATTVATLATARKTTAETAAIGQESNGVHRVKSFNIKRGKSGEMVSVDAVYGD